jgi:hypothetical protein
MNIYLTKPELLREESLFAPSEESYAPLEGKAYDIRSFKEEIVEDKDMPSIPPS